MLYAGLIEKAVPYLMHEGGKNSRSAAGIAIVFCRRQPRGRSIGLPTNV
jgi:hypothetical protein